jgi:hypothetical protein
MKRALLLFLAISLVVAAFAQKKKKKSDLPMAVVAAQFVYITSMHGDSFNPRTTVEEREAMRSVDGAVRAWGRYKIVYRPEDANLMLVVKTSGMGSARVGVGLPPIDTTNPGTRIDPRNSPIGGLGTGAEISSDPNDMLMVSLTPQEPAQNAAFLWRRSARHGFQGNKPDLVEEFRSAVEETARQNAKP